MPDSPAPVQEEKPGFKIPPFNVPPPTMRAQPEGQPRPDTSSYTPDSVTVPVRMPGTDFVTAPMQTPEGESVTVPVRAPEQESVTVPVRLPEPESVTVPVRAPEPVIRGYSSPLGDETVAITPAPDPGEARRSREPEPTPQEFAAPYPGYPRQEQADAPPPAYGAQPGAQWGQQPPASPYQQPFIPPYPGAQPPQGAQGYGYAPPAPGYAPPGQSAVPPQKKIKTPVIIGIAAACVIVIVAGIVLAYMNFGGNGSAKTGFDTYNELITDYFIAFQDENTDIIAGYFLPEIIQIFESDGYTRDRAVEYLDALYGDYGLRIKSWEITDTVILDMEDTYLDFTNVDASKIQDIKSVEIEMTVGKDDDVWFYYFEVVKLDGKWYLIEVW